MKRNAAKDEKLKKKSKKPKIDPVADDKKPTAVVKPEPKAYTLDKSKGKKTLEKPKSKAKINEKSKLAGTNVEKQNVQKC